MTNLAISPLNPPFDPETERLLASMMPPGVPPIALFRTLARNPRLLRKMHAGHLLDKGGLSLRERELIIDRTTALCGCEYEWGVHIAFFGERAEFDVDQIRATVLGDANDPAWREEDRLVIRLTDELHSKATVSDETMRAARARWSDAQILEFFALAGYYHMVSFIANGARVPLEQDAPRFPESKGLQIRPSSRSSATISGDAPSRPFAPSGKSRGASAGSR